MTQKSMKNSDHLGEGAKDLLPSLTQSIHLEESRPPHRSQVGIFTICMILVLFITWAWLTPIEEVAIAQGQITPTEFIKTVQHLEGGIISEIYVNEGDFVKESQLLLRLDGKAAASELDTLKIREKGLQIRAERLRAVGLNTQPDFAKFGDNLQSIVTDQKSIYEIQIKNRNDQRAVIDKQLEQRKAQLAIQLGQEQDYREQLAVVQQQRDVNKQLFEKRLLTGTEYRRSEENLTKVRKDLNQVMNQTQETRQLIAEEESRLLELDTRLRNEALTEMGNVTADLSQVTEAKAKLEDRVQRLEIKAPIGGIVKGIKNHTIGGVVQAGAEVMQIVPVDALEVEAQVRPQDMGNVKVGLQATVKVSAYEFSRFGGIKGQLRSISASTFLDEKNVPYYKVYISLDHAYVGNNADLNRVTPGMTVQSDIKTGKKTLLQYLIKPVYNAWYGAFREK